MANPEQVATAPSVEGLMELVDAYRHALMAGSLFTVSGAAYDAILAYAESLATEAYAEGRRDEQEELSSVLPGTTYMDPPDGGAPTILEQLQRQAKDATRYLWLRQRFSAADFDWNESGQTMLMFAFPRGVTVSADCDRTIDAALSKDNQGGQQ